MRLLDEQHTISVPYEASAIAIKPRFENKNYDLIAYCGGFCFVMYSDLTLEEANEKFQAILHAEENF